MIIGCVRCNVNQSSPHPGRDSWWPVALAFVVIVTANAFASAFLPLHTRSLPVGLPVGWLGADLAAGLPISLFWLAVAGAQLTTHRWEQGRDHHRLLLIAGLLSALGLAGAAWAGTAITLSLWRGLGGFGFGAVLILTQDHLLRAFGPAARTRASGLYLSLFFAGTIAGTLAGGGLADWIGPGLTLVAAALLTATALLPALGAPHYRDSAAPALFRPSALLGNRSLMVLLLCAAIPSRLINAGFVFYIVPLYLADQGIGTATIGWVVAIYSALLAVLTAPWSRLIDRVGHPELFVLAGALVSVASVLVMPLILAGLPGAIAAVTLLGLAQSIGMSPQITVLFRVAAEEMERYGRTRLLGLYRVAERLGLFLGPVAAGGLVAVWGYAPAQLVLAALLAVASVILALAVGVQGVRRAAE